MTKNEKTILKNSIVKKLKETLVPSFFKDNSASRLKFKNPISVAEGLKFVHKVGDSPTCSWKTDKPNKIIAIERITSKCFNVKFIEEVAPTGTGYNSTGSSDLPLASMPLEIMQKIAQNVNNKV